MDALTLLHERVSVPRLVGPAPTAEQQQAMFLAALRAPDHAYLRPWRFLVIEGSGLDALGELFGRAALADEIADSAAFLASPEAAIITGEVLRLDGGRSGLAGILD